MDNENNPAADNNIVLGVKEFVTVAVFTHTTNKTREPFVVATGFVVLHNG